MKPQNQKNQIQLTKLKRIFSFKTLIILIVLAVGFGMGYVYAEYRQNDNSGSNFDDPHYNIDRNISLKPVIYLYPNEVTEVNVNLNYKGRLISTFPEYNESIGGWKVVAKPDGTLINTADGKEYSYLFWDGEDNTNYDLSSGFVVKGSDTKEFLQSTLAKMGLTSREYNEMIVFWLPKMEHNNYNLIHFAGSQYTETAKLKISPEPDSLLRVFMVFKPLDEYVKIQPQELTSFERKGFTVVEWGGTELK